MKFQTTDVDECTVYSKVNALVPGESNKLDN